MSTATNELPVGEVSMEIAADEVVKDSEFSIQFCVVAAIRL